MKYKTLLFDVDNTLLDFDANERQSFKSMITELGEEYSDERYEAYRNLNKEMWEALERGELTAKELWSTRFSRFMLNYGKEVNGQEWERVFRTYLNNGTQEMPDVHDVLNELREKYRLFIITNGAKVTQDNRLNGSGLIKYFSNCFISEAVGASKPSKEYFDFVKSNIEEFDDETTLVIGDSLTSDIKGGNNAGIDTCWICKKGTVNNTDIIPTYTIHSLMELLTLLNS